MARMFPALILALFVAACASPPLRQATPVSVSPVTVGAGQERTTDQVILIGDSSGTMVASDLFPDAKALLQSMVAALPAGDVASSRPKPYEAGLVGFGGTERRIAPLAAFDRAALASTAADLVPLGSRDGRGGETPYRHVLPELGTALEGKAGRAALVFVSDGRADQPSRGMDAARAMVEAHNATGSEVCIHTVQMGDHPEGGAFLTELAALTSCGSNTAASALSGADGIARFVASVMFGPGGSSTAQAPIQVGPCDGVIRLQGVRFAFDKWNITPDSAVVLDVAAEQLRACQDLQVSVEGHTDFIGTDAYNQGLSERRAGSVKDYLVSKGIPAVQMRTVGYGESRPIAPGRTDEDRAQNRRVELVPIQ